MKAVKITWKEIITLIIIDGLETSGENFKKIYNHCKTHSSKAETIKFDYMNLWMTNIFHFK